MAEEKLKKILEKQHYGIVGRHSAVQICRWTKKSLVDEGFCYKEKFYGVKSHLCCQMSPCILCFNQCLHCWRPIELGLGKKLQNPDEAGKIIDGCIREQRRLINGFGGNKKLNKKKFKEAQEPMQFAISLIGEPTIYPKLAELIKELRKRKKTSFLVTNGLLPERLLELKKKNALPTQLYVSLNSPNKKLYNIWHRSRIENAWKKFNQTLELLPGLNTRKVLRLTLVRGLNMDLKYAGQYAELIEKADPDFVEVKGYISVGFARKRLGYEKMPTHEEVKRFAEEILAFLPKLKFLDEKIYSRVVLLGKSRRSMKIKRREI